MMILYIENNDDIIVVDNNIFIRGVIFRDIARRIDIYQKLYLLLK